MGIFDRLQNWLRRFMAGRNGWDALNQALLFLYIALWFLGVVVAAVLGRGLFVWLFNLLMDAALLFLLFRLLSRNIAKRQSENLWWLNSPLRSGVWKRLRALSALIARLRDRDHKYFKCSHCGAYCRVPKGKGRIVITCPRCRMELKGKS